MTTKDIDKVEMWLRLNINKYDSFNEMITAFRKDMKNDTHRRS